MRLFFILLVGLFLSCGSASDQQVLDVACAANMQYAMDSIAVVFEKESGIQCELTYGSSGMLATQILNGAPYDVFISANMNYPNSIFDKGYGQKPVNFGKGRLVFVMAKNTGYNAIDEALADNQLERIGVAFNQTAPYGMAAYEFLEALGKKEELESQLVIGESIGQVNQYIATKSVDAAFTSYAFKVKKGNEYDYFEVDQELFNPIDQGIMILNGGLKNKKADSNELLTFFASSKCKAVLNYFGYLTD